MTERGTWDIRVEDFGTVVVLRGEIDLSNAETVRCALEAAVPSAGHLVIDLAEVTFFDSSGVHLLDAVAGAAEAAGTTVRVVAPEGSRARFVLRICAFREDLLAETLDDAR